NAGPAAGLRVHSVGHLRVGHRGFGRSAEALEASPHGPGKGGHAAFPAELLCGPLGVENVDIKQNNRRDEHNDRRGRADGAVSELEERILDVVPDEKSVLSSQLIRIDYRFEGRYEA